MMTFIARMTVKPDKEADFVRLAKQLTEQVRANEPECRFYEFYKLREPLRYAVVESFTSEEAEEAHLQTSYFNEIAPPLIECLDGTYVREYLDDLE